MLDWNAMRDYSLKEDSFIWFKIEEFSRTYLLVSADSFKFFFLNFRYVNSKIFGW